jgi:hypothetical protein
VGLSVNKLITELRETCGVDSSDLPTTDAELLLNRSWWDLMNKIEFRETEMASTFQTVVGLMQYTMTVPFESLKSLSLLNPVTNEQQLINVMDTRLYDANFKPDVLSRGIPTMYFRENTAINLYPTPDKVYTITLRYITTLNDLEAGTAEPDVPQVWHEIILLGAAWRCYQRLGDMARKDSLKGDWLGLLNNVTTVKEQELVDTKFAAVIPLRRNYGVYRR